MKKSILMLSSVLFFISCGNNTETKETPAADTVTAVKETRNVVADAGLALMSKSDCFTCHKLTESSIGPAYAAVAAKYSTMDAQAAKDSITHQIIHGGSGKWGTVAMQPHPLVTKGEADTMAVYILSIKND